MKFIKITSFILILGIALYFSNRNGFIDKMGLLFGDSVESDQGPQTRMPQAQSIKQLSFKQQQMLQQKYLTAAGHSGMFPNDLSDTEKSAFIQEALSDLYHSQNAGDRELAVMTLGEFTGKEVVEAMLYALLDPDDLIREQAVLQISEWKNEKERTELILKVLQGSDPDALVLILESISELSDDVLTARIKGLLDHPEQDVREAAQLALELQD